MYLSRYRIPVCVGLAHHFTDELAFFFSTTMARAELYLDPALGLGQKRCGLAFLGRG